MDEKRHLTCPSVHQQNLAAAAGDFHSAKEPIHKINLKSILIGNGLTEPYTQFESIPEFVRQIVSFLRCLPRSDMDVCARPARLLKLLFSPRLRA
jgi:hypothetical protein